jgi:hypothetical protein
MRGFRGDVRSPQAWPLELQGDARQLRIERRTNGKTFAVSSAAVGMLSLYGKAPALYHPGAIHDWVDNLTFSRRHQKRTRRPRSAQFIHPKRRAAIVVPS